jgi:hypothetical protein
MAPLKKLESTKMKIKTITIAVIGAIIMSCSEKPTSHKAKVAIEYNVSEGRGQQEMEDAAKQLHPKAKKIETRDKEGNPGVKEVVVYE